MRPVHGLCWIETKGRGETRLARFAMNVSRMRRLNQRRGKSERGFALLLVFLLASAVAFMLYRQLPRVAFESERDKEQTLIDHGEQYRRSIQIFYVTNKRFPTTMD